MKKILFILLTAATLFSSCSSDDISNDGATNNTEKYTVNLNVKSAGFEVDKTPIKATTAVDTKLFQYVIYNEDGSVYSDSVYWDAQVNPLFNDKNEIPLQLELPEGKYHLALLYMPVYNINIEDAQTFDVPEGTNALQFVVNPLYYGINVKSKLAPFEDNRPIIFSLDSIRTNATFNKRITVSKSIADNTIKAKINYLKIDGDTTILDSKQLPIPNSTLENGYYYNIHGNLGNKSSGQLMNISLGEFNKEDVNIEF